MTHRFIFIFSVLATVLMIVSCGRGRSNVPVGAVSPEEHMEVEVSCPQALLDFFTENAREYGRGGGTVVPQPLRDELMKIDDVRKICSGYGTAGMDILYLGSLDVSDSLDFHVLAMQNPSAVTPSVEAALILKEGKAAAALLLEDDGKESGFSVKTERLSRNEFLIGTFSVDMVEENGKPKGGYDLATILDNGTVKMAAAND